MKGKKMRGVPAVSRAPAAFQAGDRRPVSHSSAAEPANVRRRRPLWASHRPEAELVIAPALDRAASGLRAAVKTGAPRAAFCQFRR